MKSWKALLQLAVVWGTGAFGILYIFHGHLQWWITLPIWSFIFLCAIAVGLVEALEKD